MKLCFCGDIMNQPRFITRFFSLIICSSLLFQPFLQSHIALRNVPLYCVHHIPSIITKNEWEELELDWLVEHLDKTQTSMGSWAFKQMLHPVAQEDQIKQRQALVRELATNLELVRRIHQIAELFERPIMKAIDFGNLGFYNEKRISHNRF